MTELGICWALETAERSQTSILERLDIEKKDSDWTENMFADDRGLKIHKITPL